MALDTVADYIAEARILLQDTVVPYRYTDAELITAFNVGLLEARKLRADLFLGRSVPSFTAVDTTAVTMDEQYRLPFVYFIVGQAELRDEEDTQDTRAGALLTKFKAQLVGMG